ncbi:MAG: hypothetical protein AAF419_03200 [Pseudomonadota bacterium]
MSMTNPVPFSVADYKSPFGLDREMGFTRKEFFKVLPRAFSDYIYEINDNLIKIELEKGIVLIEIGDERERRYTDYVYFPILPVNINFVNVDDNGQSRFLRKFDASYMKGLA